MLAAWDRPRLVGFFDSIRAAGRTPVTIHTYASIVHRFLSWCVEADLLPEDPLAGFTVAPPTSPGKPPWPRGSSSSEIIFPSL